MIGLYVASTCYHLIPYGEKRTPRLRVFDHIMIFFMIAGTYTPICLIPIRGPWGWSLFGVVWGLALAGLVLKLFWMNAPRFLSTGTYSPHGVAGRHRRVPAGADAATRRSGLAPGGGACSTPSGASSTPLSDPTPWPGWFGFHEIFHIFVMLGTFSHFWVMYRYVTRFS